MQTYDIIMLVVLALATCSGALKGLVWQVASLAALFASYLVAFHYGPSLAAWLPVGRPWNVALAMLALFLGTAAGIWLVCQWIRDWLDRMRLRSFDRQIGALLGLAKGIVFCTILTGLAVTLMGPSVRAAVARSHAGHLVGRLLDRAERLLPAELNEILEPFVNTVEENMRNSREKSGSNRT
jgi:membrane protein required for colicin V production